jgi:hypothetical protein
MKKLALLLLALPLAACATARGVTSEKSPQLARPTPSPESRTALKCVIGLAPPPCQTLFAAAAARIFIEGTIYQIDFETIKFAGTSSSGDDVWDVKSPQGEFTYVIAPPDQDGKIRHLAILEGPPNNLCVETAMTFFNLGHGFESCRVMARAR